VVLQSNLRPKAPVMRDTVTWDIDNEQELIIKELEAEEQARKSLIDKLIRQ